MLRLSHAISTRENTYAFASLQHPNGLPYFDEPSQPFLIGAGAVNEGILSCPKRGLVGQSLNMKMKVVDAIERRDMEPHPERELVALGLQ